MHFQAHASGFLKPVSDLSLLSVWSIESRELSQHGRDVLQLLEDPTSEFKDSYRLLVWTAQAILEFQDLQPVMLPERGSFLHTNYLFIQSLEALRQAVLTGLNGQTHASLAVLRSALEQFIFHYWWRSRLLKEPTFESFYAWLRGMTNTTKKRISISGVMSETIGALDLPAQGLSLGDVIANFSSERLDNYVVLRTLPFRLRGWHNREPP